MFAGQNFDAEQAVAFQQAVDDTWVEALYEAGKDGDEALANGLQAMLDRTFERWRAFIGVDLLNQYGRELMLSAIDREWVDYLTAMEDLRQGIGLQGIAQRDPLVIYKTEAYRMFEELMITIDRATMRSFFNNLPRYVGQMQQQRASSQTARVRDLKVGPNEPCPCGSGKKFKKCHGAPAKPAAAAPRAVAALAATMDDTKIPSPAKPTQQQMQKQAAQDGQRRKSKGRSVPGRKS